MNIAAAIEKNRLKLLRLAVCWLAVALCVRHTRLILPSRLGRWVCHLIFTAETATGFLMMACGYDAKKCVASERAYLTMAQRYDAGFSDDRTDGCVSIEAIIERLKALRAALKRLAITSKLNQNRNIACFPAFKRWQPNHVFEFNRPFATTLALIHKPP